MRVNASACAAAVAALAFAASAAAQETETPDAMPEAAADAVTEAAPEAVADPAPEAAAEAAVEAVTEAAPAAAVEAAPAAAAEVAPVVTAAPAVTAGGPDYSLPATYGEVTLITGFLPDPHVTNLESGGNIDASMAITNASGACLGYIAQAPDLRLHYTAGPNYPLIISVGSAADTTLVVNTPDGQWHCDDDGGQGLNPSLGFEAPMTGQYDIWVGTYGVAALAPAELAISEVGSH